MDYIILHIEIAVAKHNHLSQQSQQHGNQFEYESRSKESGDSRQADGTAEEEYRSFGYGICQFQWLKIGVLEHKRLIAKDVGGKCCIGGRIVNWLGQVFGQRIVDLQRRCSSAMEWNLKGFVLTTLKTAQDEMSMLTMMNMARRR